MRPITLVAIFLLAPSLAACGGDAPWRSDELSPAREKAVVADDRAGLVRRDYLAGDFTGVAISGPDDVEIMRGDGFEVTATGREAVLDLLSIRVQDGRLDVRRRSDAITGGDDDAAAIRITMPILASVALAGSGDLTAQELTGERANLNLTGSGSAKFTTISARALEISIAGSGDVEAMGQVDAVDISIAGSGDVDAPGLTATRADISISGSGDVAMTVTGSADVSVIGSGDVTLTGGAECSQRTMGSGRINCR